MFGLIFSLDFINFECGLFCFGVHFSSQLMSGIEDLGEL
jgi:hypothetical protein